MFCLVYFSETGFNITNIRFLLSKIIEKIDASSRIGLDGHSKIIICQTIMYERPQKSIASPLEVHVLTFDFPPLFKRSAPLIII